MWLVQFESGRKRLTAVEENVIGWTLACVSLKDDDIFIVRLEDTGTA